MLPQHRGNEATSTFHQLPDSSDDAQESTIGASMIEASKAALCSHGIRSDLGRHVLETPHYHVHGSQRVRPKVWMAIGACSFVVKHSVLIDAGPVGEWLV